MVGRSSDQHWSFKKKKIEFVFELVHVMAIFHVTKEKYWSTFIYIDAFIASQYVVQYMALPLALYA